MFKTKIKRGTFHHVESELFGFHESKKAITSLIDDILHGSSNGDENVGGGRGSLPGNPTLQRATILATHRLLESMQATVKAIEQVYEQARPEYKHLMELRYWRHPQTLTWDGIAQELKVSRKQALLWRNAIVQAVAEKMGWS